MKPIDLALSPRILRPPPSLTVSEWAASYRILSSESSATPGSWSNDTTPYLTEIMDQFCDPVIEHVTVMSSSQIGKTECLLNVLGYCIGQDPAPCLLVQPTVAIAESFAKDRLVPMLRDTPQLHSVVDLRRNNSKPIQDTMLHRTFKGGHVTLIGSNAPASLAARPIKILLLDEVDRYPPVLKSEGDVVALAVKRTTAFFNRKIFMVSSPTVAGVSRIEKEYLQGDQRKWFVPCPHCHELQFLELGGVEADFGLKWPEGEPGKAAYQCKYCHELIPNHLKQAMLLHGEWRATAPSSSPRTRSYHINELSSPFVSFGELAEHFLEAKKYPETLRTFFNTALGIPWEDQAEHIDPSSLMMRAEKYETIPDGVLVLTCGVDIQTDRIEAEVVGYGRNQESWGIVRKIIHGDPSQVAIWLQLDEFLKTTWAYQDQQIGIAITCIDSGYCTDQVYKFVLTRAARRIFAVKGVAGEGKTLVGKPLQARGLSRSIKVFPVAGNTAKDTIYAHLDAVDGPTMHFPDSYPQEFYDQLTAEKCITKFKAGVSVRQYVKIRPRNEALDIRCYSLAALKLLQIDLDRLETPFNAGKRINTDVEVKKVAQESLNAYAQRIRGFQRNSGSFVDRWK